MASADNQFKAFEEFFIMKNSVKKPDRKATDFEWSCKQCPKLVRSTSNNLFSNLKVHLQRDHSSSCAAFELLLSNRKKQNSELCLEKTPKRRREEFFLKENLYLKQYVISLTFAF